MWTKIANYSISMREVATTFFYKDSTGKTTFLRGGVDSSSIIRDLHRYDPERSISVAKGLTLKVRIFGVLFLLL